MRVIKQGQLPLSNIAHELVGTDYGVGVCIIFVDAPPGAGPSLHKHPYEEIFIVLEGEATFLVADEEFHARAGEIAIVPADTPHGFRNAGEGRLRQIDIHVSRSFETEWL